MKPEKKVYYREDGSVDAEGWKVEGELHRLDGPALIWYRNDGSIRLEEWWVVGEPHRLEGPAWVRYREDGSVESEEWWVEGKKFTKKEFEQYQIVNSIDKDFESFL